MQEKVPNILTGKDLNYLSDMFAWNYEALKQANHAIKQVEDNAIENLLKEGASLFEQNLKQVLYILGKDYE